MFSSRSASMGSMRAARAVEMVDTVSATALSRRADSKTAVVSGPLNIRYLTLVEGLNMLKRIPNRED
jgi:hypothetical protein